MALNNPNDELYKSSYAVFWATIIYDKVIKQRKITRMRIIHEMFIKQVDMIDNLDVSNYRVFHLKTRLQRDYSQLVFHLPTIRNQSEFVFVE